MSKIKTCLYLIEFKDGRNDTMNKEKIEASVDDIFNDISKIVKSITKECGCKKRKDKLNNLFPYKKGLEDGSPNKMNSQ